MYTLARGHTGAVAIGTMHLKLLHEVRPKLTKRDAIAAMGAKETKRRNKKHVLSIDPLARFKLENM